MQSPKGDCYWKFNLRTMKRRKNVVSMIIQREYGVRGHLRKNLLIMRCLICQVYS